LTAGSTIRATEFHTWLGHVNDDYMRLTAKEMSVTISGTLHACEACAVGKAKQKAVPKSDDREFSHPGELIYMDLVGIKTPSKGNKRY
jgi:hypothetical protein